MAAASAPASLAAAGLNDYVSLMKPRVMTLVVFTALVGMLLAPGGGDPVLAIASLIAIAVGAGASAALNMAYDADIDALMERTRSRPVPAGAIARSEAAALGIVLALFSVMTLVLASNYLAAGLLAFTIFFYGVVYTMWLKRSTPQNIVIGGAAGALPPVIGYVAIAGDAPLAVWSLFLIIFLWTPPHFWALALNQSAGYAKAGVPMMPNVAGERSTRVQIFSYTLLLVASTALPYALGIAGMAYAVTAAVAGAAVTALAWRLLRAPSEELRGPAMRLFGGSIVYLFVLFAALMAERLAAFLA